MSDDLQSKRAVILGERISAIGLPLTWFYRPHPQLNGRTPKEVCEDGGLAEVEAIVDQLESGGHV